SLSHWYLVECGLTALVCLTLWLMAGWDGSSGAGRAVLLGITLALGLLMKASFPLYVVVPFAWYAWRWRASLRPATVATLIAVVLVVAAPWYGRNAQAMLDTTLKAGSAETARIYDTGQALSLLAVGHYLGDVVNAAPWLYLAALPLFALVG